MEGVIIRRKTISHLRPVLAADRHTAGVGLGAVFVLFWLASVPGLFTQ